MEKSFTLKCEVINSETKQPVGFRVVTVYGENGNSAVGRYSRVLKEEGLELGESYSYSENRSL